MRPPRAGPPLRYTPLQRLLALDNRVRSPSHPLNQSVARKDASCYLAAGAAIRVQVRGTTQDHQVLCRSAQLNIPASRSITAAERAQVIYMLLLIIVLVLLFGGGGGFFYGRNNGWGGSHYGGGLVGLVLIILLILFLTGNIGAIR